MQTHVFEKVAPSPAVRAAEPGLPSGERLRRIPAPKRNLSAKMRRGPTLGRATQKGGSGPAGANLGRVPVFEHPYQGMT